MAVLRWVVAKDSVDRQSRVFQQPQEIALKVQERATTVALESWKKASTTTRAVDMKSVPPSRFLRPVHSIKRVTMMLPGKLEAETRKVS